MAKSLNKVMLIGNVGKEPETRYTSNGKAVTNFSLATNESWKGQDGNTQERVEWHNVVAWDKLAEIISQYVHKGSRIYIEGRTQTRSYDDTATGVKRCVTEVVASQMLMLDGKQAGAQPAAAQDEMPF